MVADKRKIVLRADGDHKIGMGHLTRSLSLAEMLQKQFAIEFATRNPEMAKSSGILMDIFELPYSSDHFDIFLNHLEGDEIVVLDNYFFNTEYQAAIRSKGCKLVCIDDIHDKHYVADVIINHSPGMIPDMFSCERYTKLCLGPDFALLRKPFLDASKRERKAGLIEKVFICFGGSDSLNITLKILKIIAGQKEIKRIELVYGPEYRESESLKYFCSDYKHIFIHSNLDATKMVKVIEGCHLAIVPASSILLEVLSVKLPVITGYYADNQVEILQHVVNGKNVLSIGDFRVLEKDILIDNMHRLIAGNKELRGSIIDGNSDRRLISLFRELAKTIKES